MKIFISVASYRDILLATTLESAYNNAAYKDSLIFGVIDQSYATETLDLSALEFNKQIRYVRIDPEYSRGVCWARHIAQTFYNEEDYYLQIDSHTIFDQDWDKCLIDRIEELKEIHDKPIITGYPTAFQVVDGDIKNLKKLTRTGWCDTMVVVGEQSFQDKNFYIRIKGDHKKDVKTVHGFLLAGGFLFSIGQIVEEVPYDPYMYFHGEEQSLSLRAWTSGYNIFHIDSVPLYHHYNDPNFQFYKRLTPWSDIETTKKKTSDRWHELEDMAKRRLTNLVTGQNLGVYSLGKTRSLEQYTEWSGIDYSNQTLNINATTGEHTFNIPYQNQIIIQ
jgi:hypothetical protein